MKSRRYITISALQLASLGDYENALRTDTISGSGYHNLFLICKTFQFSSVLLFLAENQGFAGLVFTVVLALVEQLRHVVLGSASAPHPGGALHAFLTCGACTGGAPLGVLARHTEH